MQHAKHSTWKTRPDTGRITKSDVLTFSRHRAHFTPKILS
jgi:hypothetical protein